MPLPPRAPPDLRIFARAMWPQTTAGIAVNSQPHVNERTAKIRLQIATGRVRGTVCGTAGGEDGGASSAIAPLYSMERAKAMGRSRSLRVERYETQTRSW